MISMDKVESTGDPSIDAMVARAIKAAPEAVEHAEHDAGPMPGPATRERIMKVLAKWRVPKRLVQELPGVDRTREAIHRVAEWSMHRPEWALLLGGEAGIGKSMAAAYWLAGKAKAHTDNLDGLKPCWFQANDLTHLDRSEYRRLWQAPRLVIDDLGAEYIADSGYFHTVLYSILSHRYDDLLPTVVTTNLSGESLRGRYQDKRLLRRLGKPHGVTVWLGGDDA